MYSSKRAFFMRITVYCVLLTLCVVKTCAFTISGVAFVGGNALTGAEITAYLAGGQSAIVLSTHSAITDSKGQFSLSLCDAPTNSVMYVVAEKKQIKLVSAFERSSNSKSTSVVVNEISTVGTVFALNQFIDSEGDIYGPYQGLYNALQNSYNLYDPSTGQVGQVISTSPNGQDSEALATLNSLANALLACTTDNQACTDLFTASKVAGSSLPTDTVLALRSIARNPANNIQSIFLLSQQQSYYSPFLNQAPNGWYLALLFTAGGFDAPGRNAFDTLGRQWITNNFQAPGTDASLQVTVLDPAGQPILNSPLSGGGIDGPGYGVTIDLDGNVWFGNFGGSTISKFNSQGQPLSPDPVAWDDGEICRPQGMAMDFDGNVWIANNDGAGQTSACPEGRGNGVTVYPKGNRLAAVSSSTDILYPFDVAIDKQGHAWVTNGGVKGGSLVVLKFDKSTQQISTVRKINNSISDDNSDDQFQHPLFSSPKTVALDSKGNAWVANAELNSVTFIDNSQSSNPVASVISVPFMLGPWGLAVDSGDRVWVADFLGKCVFLLCGSSPDACPEGSQGLGDSLSPTGGFAPSVLQHLTAIQLDESGNVWTANNIVPNSTLNDYKGGNGMVQFVGLGFPVRTPLTGLPVPPKATQDPSLSSKCQQSSTQASRGESSTSSASTLDSIAVHEFSAMAFICLCIAFLN